MAVKKSNAVAVTLAVAGVITLVVWLLWPDVENVQTRSVYEDFLTDVFLVKNGSIVAENGFTASGQVDILENGTRHALRIVDFESSDCADLVISLGDALNITIPNAMMVESVLPGNVDVEDYDGFVLYCQTSGEVFGRGDFVEQESPIVSFGEFESRNDYTVKGNITILRKNEGFVMRFNDIEVQSGPDVFLYLTPNEAPNDVSTEGTIRIELDAIPGGFFAQEGTFRQALPDGVDGTKFNGANVWCRRFGATFGLTTLRKP